MSDWKVESPWDGMYERMLELEAKHGLKMPPKHMIDQLAEEWADGAQAQARQIAEEMDKPCPHTTTGMLPIKKRECYMCWQAFRQEAGL